MSPPARASGPRGAPGTLRAVLFDVGGTLLSETLLKTEDELEAMRRERLRAAFGGGRPWFEALARQAFEAEEHDGVPYRQATREAVRRFVRGLGYELTDDAVELVRAARCLPSIYAEEPLPGAHEALRHAKRRGLRVALVTNVLWRTAADSRADWQARGVGDCIDAIVTSIDVGWRKPHAAIFERALADLAVAPGDAVMVGNSRAADIAPAKRLGMRAVLVRSGEQSTSGVDASHIRRVVASVSSATPHPTRPSPELGPRGARGRPRPSAPSAVAPDAVIEELAELPALLDGWLGVPGPGRA